MKLSKEQLEWRTQEDVRTLERYQEIMQDKSRLSRATKAAKETADNLVKRSNAIKQSVARTKRGKK